MVIKLDSTGVHKGSFLKLFDSKVSKEQIQKDVSLLRSYNEAVKHGCKQQETFDRILKESSKSAKDFATQAKGGTVNIGNYEKSVKSSTIATKAWQVATALANAAIIAGASFLVSKGIEALNNYVNKQSIAIEKARELSDAWKEQQESISSNGETIKSISSDYQTLARGVNEFGENISLNAEEYAKYNRIVNQIADMFPTMVRGYTDEGNAIIAHKGNVEALTKAYQEQKEAAENAIIIGSGDVFSGFKASMHGGFDGWTKVTRGDATNKQAFDLIEKYNNLIKDGKADAMELQSELSKLGIEGSAFSYILQLAGIQDYKPNSNSSMVEAALNNIDNIAAYAEKLETEMNAQAAQIRPIVSAYLNADDEYQNLPDSTKDTIKQIVSQMDSEFYNQFENTPDMMSGITDSLLSNFQGKDGAVIAKSFTDMFDVKAKFNNGEVSLDEYTEKLDNIREIIGSWDNDVQKSVNLLLNTDIDGESLDVVVANVQGKLKDEFDDRVGELSFAELQIAYKIENDGDMTFDELKANIQTLNQSPVSFDLSNISDNLKTFNEKISEVYSSMDLLDKAADEFSQSGVIASQTFKSLSDNNLLRYLQFTSDGLTILTDELLANEQATKQKAQADLAAALYSDLLALATSGVSDEQAEAERLAAATGNAVETMGQQFANAVAGTLSEAEALRIFKAVAKDEVPSGFDFEGQEKQFNQLIGNYNSVVNTIAKMGNTTDSSSNAFNRMASSAQSAADITSQAFSSAKSSIDSLVAMVVSLIKNDINTSIASLQKQLSALQSNYNSNRNALEESAKKQRELYKDQEKAIENTKNALKKELDIRIQLLKTQQDERSYQKDIDERNKNISDLRRSITDLNADDSLEGIAKRKELEEQLAKELSDLEDVQYDNSVKKQEDALTKEYNRFVEIENNKLEILKSEEEFFENSHNTKLQRLEQAYEASRLVLENQITDLQAKLQEEGTLRREAMDRINSGGQELYNDLIQYNRIYGDGVDATVTEAWNSAYSAIDKFGGGQRNVLSTLNSLVKKMNEYDKSINSAANSASRLNSVLQGGAYQASGSSSSNNKQQLQSMLNRAQKDLQLSTPGTSQYNEIKKTINELKNSIKTAEIHHTGIESGVVGGPLYKTSGSEVLTKLMKGEIVITPEQAKIAERNIYNNSSNFVENNTRSLQSILNKTGAMLNEVTRNIQPVSASVEIDQSGDIIINGGANESIIPVIKKVIKDCNKSITDMVSNTLMDSLKTRSVKIN